MRIAYIAHVNYARESGVVKKVLSQTSLWCELGETARIFWLTREHGLQQGASDLEEGHLYQGGPFSPGRWRALNRLVASVLKWPADVVYLRRDMFYPAYLWLAKRIPVVVEVNANELAELWLYSKTHYAYHGLSRALLDRRVRGFVFTTHELAQSLYYRRFKVPRMVIGNGVDLRKLPQLPPTANDKPVVAFIGQAAPWHGIDKILEMARAFPEWTFHLIGLDAVDPSLSNVVTHGFLDTEEYLPILARADVGIGTLALHRNKMREASPLKVREYLALGLPVIIGYEDTDFPGGAPFLLRLPNSEDNVFKCKEEIRAFVEGWRGRRVSRADILHLDQRAKEERRLRLLRDALRKASCDRVG